MSKLDIGAVRAQFPALNTHEATVFLDERAHTTILFTTPEIREIVWLDDSSYLESVEVIARELEARGLGKAVIGIEKWGYSPHARLLDAL